MSIQPVPGVSIVIVTYEMQREIERTIRSFAPGMQRGVRADEYELIVVDNGSTAHPPDRRACARHGGRIRWLNVDHPTPSPAPAVNLGLAAAAAPLVGVMVDGARMASPGLVAAARDAAIRHVRPVVATLAYHLGPGPQQETVGAGYDKAAEDSLLAEAGWTEDGYRLFDVSVLAPSSASWPSELPLESNALFMPREMWRELGGFDERFLSAGGGLVNLDAFARACALPGAEVIMLLAEATFHQVHGGVSTNSAISGWDRWHAEYMRLRGHPFERPTADVVCVGRMPKGHG